MYALQGSTNLPTRSQILTIRGDVDKLVLNITWFDAPGTQRHLLARTTARKIQLTLTTN